MSRIVPLAAVALVLLAAACDSSTTDRPARADDLVTVDYVGTLEDGTVFDRGTGATFPLQSVIPGFRNGIVGMRVGETKTLVIPPDQAYGAMGAPPRIPPNATLTFVVTLRAIGG